MKINSKTISYRDLKTCRYLLRFSYMGTNYTGLQRQTNRDAVVDNEQLTDLSVQYQIENALVRRLRPIYGARLAISSRTDGGVHAVTNTAHVDLTHPHADTVYKPSFITQSVNTYLAKTGQEIRLLSTQMVPNGFNSRGDAQWRSYLYRLAVIDPEVIDPIIRCIDCYLPIWELNKCHIIKGPVNVDEMLRLVDLFKGQHDFGSYTPKPEPIGVKQLTRDTVKTIIEFNVNQSSHLHQLISNDISRPISLWTFEIKCKSFLYNQIRRMIGSIIDVGLKRFTYKHMEYLLNNPCYKNWEYEQTVAPSKGLWLLNVHYDPKDLEVYDDLGDKVNDSPNSYPDYSEISHFKD